MSKFCVNCGKEIPEGNNVCTNCGAPVNNSPVTSAPTTQAQAGTTVVVNNVDNKGNGMATAGLIVSLVSTLLCCGSLSWLSLIFSIVGVVKSNDLGGKGKGAAIAGKK